MTRKFHPQSVSYPTAAALETHHLHHPEDRELGYKLAQHIFDDERGRSTDFDGGYAEVVKLRKRLGKEKADAFFMELRGNVERAYQWMRAQPVKND